MRKPVILLIGLIVSSCATIGQKFETRNKVYYLDPDAQELQFGSERLPLNHPQAGNFYCANPETWDMVLGHRGAEL